MRPADQDSVVRYANESGFPLQIAVQHAVDESVPKTGWNVRYVEHAWVHPTEDRSGFIDLVLHNHRSNCFFVVECKRQRDASWVFMHYSGRAKDRRHAKPWVTSAMPDGLITHEWVDKPADPACPEATYCALRGQAASEKGTLLERTGAELVLATEALAHAERNFRPTEVPTVRSYFPLIVTTADLKVVDFDPADVSLIDGQISNATARDVKFLRFRKQLATRFVELGQDDLEQSDPSYTMESSLFVVQAKYLVEFLAEFEMPT